VPHAPPAAAARPCTGADGAPLRPVAHSKTVRRRCTKPQRKARSRLCVCCSTAVRTRRPKRRCALQRAAAPCDGAAAACLAALQLGGVSSCVARCAAPAAPSERCGVAPCVCVALSHSLTLRRVCDGAVLCSS
jgi:hypothetical protein